MGAMDGKEMTGWEKLSFNNGLVDLLDRGFTGAGDIKLTFIWRAGFFRENYRKIRSALNSGNLKRFKSERGLR